MQSIFISSAAACIVYVIDVCLSVCLSSNISQIVTNSSCSRPICLILTKLGRPDLCANTQKTAEQIFESLILEFLANFF